MPKVNRFDRWRTNYVGSWTHNVFKSYTLELDRMFWTHIVSSKNIYQTLGSKKANWTDKADLHFQFDIPNKRGLFIDLKHWSNSYNLFDNWVNLNCLMALSSNLEVFMTSIIKLALESDPGVIFGVSKKIDGVTLLKYSQKSKIEFENYIISCTKGEWGSRVTNYKKIFGIVPKLLTDSVSSLEAIRILRNKVGHAFGRDIKEAQKHGVRKPLPMERLSRTRTIKYQRLIGKIAKQLDIHLMTTHIGEYQNLNFYHRLYPSLDKAVPINQRAYIFRKKIGEYGMAPLGKRYCEQLTDYYENL